MEKRIDKGGRVSSNISKTKIDTENRIDEEGTVSSNISQTKTDIEK